MKVTAFFRRSLVLTAAALCLAPNVAWCEDYPGKPIRVIIPYAAGGPIDRMVQMVGKHLSEVWGQQFVMDHRPGAGGLLGGELAAKAPPNGYTLLVGSLGPMSVAPSLYRKMPYDPVKDFVPITLSVTYPNLMVVSPSLSVNSVRDFVALAKARPGQLNFSSGGTGGSIHLAGELFKQMAGVNMIHVPYKGAMAALTDTVSGQVQVCFGNVGPTLPFVKAGKLKALAVTSAKRSALVPDLPTVAESGVPGYEVVTWTGFWAPTGTPEDIIGKLNVEIVKVLQNPQMQAASIAQGEENTPTTPKQADAFLRADIAKWARVVKEANIKVD